MKKEMHQEVQGLMHHPQHTSSNALPNDSGFGNVQAGLDQDFLLLDQSNIAERLKHCTGNNWKNLNVLQGIIQGPIEGGKEEKETSWHRMKWTDEMVKLLITAASYVGEECLSQHYKSKQSFSIFPKKGKWRAISHVMMERGHQVSPQQCEDKFNDLNKKYKRLNEILGRGGIACKVVENPSLLESMDLPDEAAEEIIKILSCKQLFYQEMCSYHNGNRIFLPYDQDLQKSLYLALKGRGKDHDGSNVGSQNALDSNRRWEHCSPHNEKNDAICLSPVGMGEELGEKLSNESVKSRLLELEEQKFKILEQRLKLEKKRLKWIRFSQKKDFELEEMRLENKVLMLENRRFAFDLKYRGNFQEMFCGNDFKANSLLKL